MQNTQSSHFKSVKQHQSDDYKEKLWEFLKWVVLLFNRANYVSLTMSQWWCFKNIYFFIMFRYNSGIWTDIKKKNNCWMCFAQNEFWVLLTLFFHEKRQGHFRLAVCSWEGETNCLNVSSCETIRLQGCCQGCFWHLAKSLRAILFPWDSWVIIPKKGALSAKTEMLHAVTDRRNCSKMTLLRYHLFFSDSESLL